MNQAAQTVNNSIDNVNNAITQNTVQISGNTVPSSNVPTLVNSDPYTPIPQIDPNAISPYTTTPATPDIPTVDNPAPPIPASTDGSGLQQIADQASKWISKITPTQAISLAMSMFKRVSGTPGTSSATYARQPNAPSSYDQLAAYYNSLNAANNYGIAANFSPIIQQLAIPALVLIGAYAISKR
jgi:hypothetical protein